MHAFKQYAHIRVTLGARSWSWNVCTHSEMAQAFRNELNSSGCIIYTVWHNTYIVVTVVSHGKITHTHTYKTRTNTTREASPMCDEAISYSPPFFSFVRSFLTLNCVLWGPLRTNRISLNGFVPFYFSWKNPTFSPSPPPSPSHMHSAHIIPLHTMHGERIVHSVDVRE